MSTDLPRPLQRAMRNAGLLDPRNDNPSLRQWATESGVHTSTISRFVAGGTSRPANVQKLADTLQVSVAELYAMVGRPAEAPWSPPAGTEKLTLRQRAALSELVLAFIEERDDLKAGEQGERDTSPITQAGDDTDEVTHANRGRLEHGQQPVPNLAEERRRRDQGKGFGHRDQGDLDHENTGTLRPPPSREDAAAYDAPNRGAEAKKKQDRDAERPDSERR